MDLKDLQKGLLACVSSQNQLIFDPKEAAYYGKDWTSSFDPNPICAVFPRSAEEVSDVLSFCSRHNLKVVPSGGRTGLAGGAVASQGEILLSLEKMNKVIEIDTTGMTMTVEAGVITQVVQEKAQEAGLFFALDLAAKGTCQIGGNIATNAGGLKFIRYGGMREQVLGLEVVLADGSIVDMNYGLRKNNTGYDLKQLFIGSEGTLGVITKATLKLLPPVPEHQLMCLGVGQFSQLLDILSLCNQQNLPLSAFEFFSLNCLEVVLENYPKLLPPFEQKYPFYALIEIEDTNQQSEQSMDALEKVFELLFERGLADDGILASSSEEFYNLWQYRELITESIAVSRKVYKNDISFSIGSLVAFYDGLQSALQSSSDEMDILIFGHLGDGNIHLNYVCDPNLDTQQFDGMRQGLEKEVFALVKKYRGSVSAEHGIGILKKNDLNLTRSDIEIDLMRRIRNAFDSKGILNPGKIF